MFQVLAIQVGIGVGLWALNKWMSLGDEKQKPIDPPRPDEITFAQSKIGSPVPYFYGRTRINDSVLIWYGFPSRPTNLIGANVSMLLNVGVPFWDEAAAPWSNWRATHPPKVHALWFGDVKSTPFTPFTQQHAAFPDGVALEDVTGDGGNYRCRVEFHDGAPDQTISTYPDAITNGTATEGILERSGVNRALLPDYQNQMLVMVNAEIQIGQLGFTAQVPMIGLEISAYGPDPVPSGDGEYDANPAWIMWDLLCGRIWKMGLTADKLDFDSWQFAAQTLVQEGHGMSIVIYRRDDAQKIFDDILQQINGVMFFDPATGTIKLKLIRFDYNIFETREMTVDNTIGRPEVTIINWRDTLNQVRVKYRDRSRDYRENVAPAQKLGNSIAQERRIRSRDVSYLGCMSGDLAATLAARDLGILGRPVLSVNCQLDRTFYDLLPGDALKAEWGPYGITNKFFRVLNVDQGQLGDGSLRVSLIEDVFQSSANGYMEDPDPVVPDVIPLVERLFDEAPYFLCARQYALGGPSLDQRMMSMGVPEGLAVRHRLLDYAIDNSGSSDLTFTEDAYQRAFAAVAFVHTEYPNTLSPYDTTTGLRLKLDGLPDSAVTTFGGMLQALNSGMPGVPIGFTPTQAQIQNGISFVGRNLILVVPHGDKSGGEFMAFEGITDNEDGTYTLTNVWRELLDTESLTHDVGATVYFVDVEHLGIKSWVSSIAYAVGNIHPAFSTIDGSGDEGDDTLAINRRLNKPIRLADVGLCGFEAIGTRGVPAVDATSIALGEAGNFKEVSDFDGALRLYGRERSTVVSGAVIIRGDATGDTADEDPGTPMTFHFVIGKKVGEDEIELLNDSGSDLFLSDSFLLGSVGHGDVDIIARTFRDEDSWRDQRVRVVAHRYRDLLAFGTWQNSDLTGATGWEITDGTPAVFQGASSLSRSPTGKYVRRFSGGTAAIRQVVDVSGFHPEGLTALATWYTRKFDTESDTTFVDVIALDNADAEIDRTSSPFFGISGPTDHYKRATLEHPIPAGTQSIALDITFLEQGGEGAGDGTPDSGVGRATLQVGQFSSELLSNPSFDGNVTGWIGANNFVFDATMPYASDDGTAGAARAGSAATSQSIQSVAVPVGYEYGTAVLTFAYAWLSATGTLGDTLSVQLIVKDGGGSVIDSSDLTSVLDGSAVTADVWSRGRVALDLPDEAATIEVLLQGSRAGGSTQGGAFDDLSLRIFKHLDPTYTRDFDFGGGSRSFAPNNWQRFHLDFPTLPIPAVWADGVASVSVRPSDRLNSGFSAGGNVGGVMRGYFNVNEVDHEDDLQCFVFERGGAGNLTTPTEVIAIPSEIDDEYGKFSADDTFTIGVLLRSTEFTWGGATGLTGRRNTDDDRGWGLQIDALGRAKATFKGDSSEVAVTSSDVLTDRSPRWVFLKVVGGVMKLLTKAGSVSTSLVGVGDTTFNDQRFRIGRDGIARDLFHGQIARVYLWDEAVPDADIEAIIDSIGADPTGLLTEWTADQPMWVPMEPDSNGNQRLARVAANHIPIGYHASFAADDDDRPFGLVLTKPNTNRINTNDVTDTAHWGPEAGSFIVVRGSVDNTGLPRGVAVTVDTEDAGFRITDMAAPLTPSDWNTVVYMKVGAGGDKTINVQLLDSAEAVKGTVAILVTDVWQRFDITHAWDGATPTAHLRFVFPTGVVGQFHISHAIWSGVEEPPIAIQDANTTTVGTFAEYLEQQPHALSFEGELYVEGVMGESNADPSTICRVDIDNGSDLDNRRVMSTVDGPAGIGLAVYASDGSGPSNVEETATLDSLWRARGRWDDLDQKISMAVEQDGSGDYALAETVMDFDPDIATPQLEAVRFGDPAGGSGSPSMLIRRLTVNSRFKRVLTH